MQTPARQVEVVRSGRSIEERQHTRQAFGVVGTDSSGGASSEEQSQALVLEADDHAAKCDAIHHTKQQVVGNPIRLCVGKRWVSLRSTPSYACASQTLGERLPCRLRRSAFRRMELSEAIPITMVRWVSQAQPILRKAMLAPTRHHPHHSLQSQVPTPPAPRRSHAAPRYRSPGAPALHGNSPAASASAASRGWTPSWRSRTGVRPPALPAGRGRA